MSMKRLQSEYKQITKDPNYFFSVNPNENNFFHWDILLIGPPETPFEGAIIKAQFDFPTTYPNDPPLFKFNSSIYHPNIYVDGKICISILDKKPDEFGYYNISDTWNPTRSIESVLMSILSILSSPNFDSPANVDASVLWRNNYDEYKKIVYKMVSNSQK